MKNHSILKKMLAVLLVIGTLLSLPVVSYAQVLVGSSESDVRSELSKRFDDVSGQYAFADRTAGFNDSVKKNPKDPNTAYWIFVHLDGKSVSERYKTSGSMLSLGDYALCKEGIDTADALKQTHTAFLQRLDEAGISYTYKYSYTLFTNAVGIKVLPADAKKIEAMSGVTKVSYSEHYTEPLAVTENNANVWGTGIYKTDGIEYDGSKLVVAVLDTGLDRSHAAFLTMPKEFGITKDQVASRIFDGNTGKGLLRSDATTTIDDVYYNAKIPFAYDYADKDSVVYPSYSVHGTHVAGIIAGNLGAAAGEFIKDSDGNPILGKNGEPLTFRSVAPEAQLVICKVFTDREDSKSLGGAETIDILAALEDCVKLGVDVINMSLGSSAGFSEGDDALTREVYQSIRDNGISLVVAASNDYSSAYGSRTGTNLTYTPDSATVGSPSTYEMALSVASISGQKSQYMMTADKEAVVFFNEVSDGNGNKKEFVKELLQKLGKDEKETVTLPFVAVQLYGQITGYTGLDVKDKIVLVERGGGSMTFEEKVRIAKMKGALAVIIYNNVSGNINMTIGGVSDIPVCSITMDASRSLLSRINGQREGEITISADLLGGPFMSDFSSWGPTPSLRLKPEITAHGGDITSSVPGGWDTLSGTSMAAPNMAGAYTLVLQYLRDPSKFATILSRNDQITLANRLIMSTPVIAYDEYGTPYSPRKQGAGLATIKNAITTRAYLYVDGTDKTKIELGDDKDKTGVYDLTFHLKNLGDIARVYDLSVLLMTESVIEDNAGVKTVAEHAYMLNDMAEITYFVNGTALTDGKVHLGANADVKITAKVRLLDEARKYLDDNFQNGMYVEGFVCLKDNDTTETAVDLSVPFLGFYGDWHAAPMFDLSAFEEAEAKQDDSIPDDEKPQAQVYATVPLGSYYTGKYIIPLGTYLYNIPTWMNKTMYASEDKVSVSMYDATNHRTAYELYSIYTGLLRGAKYMTIKITDTTTGEVIYEETQTNIRKAFSGGSTTASAANVLLELSPQKLGLANNRKYQIEMFGQMDQVLDHGYPATREEDSFSCTFYVDNEAPELIDYRVRFDPYKEGKETKYKVYLDMDVYDNHYAQSVALCYLNNDEMELELLTGEWIPIESTRGGITTVSIDITDYYNSDIEMYIQVDDYALNTRAYRLSDWKTLAEAVVYPENVQITNGDQVQLDIGEVQSLSVKVTPDNTASTNLYWTSSNEKVVKVKNGELYAVGEGTATVTVYAAPNASTKNKATIRVHVTDQVSTKQIKLKSLKLGLLRNGDGAMVDPTELMDVHPNTTYVLNVSADPWYFPGELDIRFESSAPDVASVDAKTGVVQTLREGTAYITATQYVGGKASAFTVTAKLNVGPEFEVSNGYLRGYHGLGGKVTIPKSLNVYYIYEEAFKNNNNITELEISEPCMEIQQSAFDGMTALKRVILPQSVTFVASDAFRNCTALERVDLHSRAITFNHRCFAGCTSLKYVQNMVVTDPDVDVKKTNLLDLAETQFTRISPKIGTLGNQAFRDCTALETVDITELRVSGESVFEGCTALRKVILSSHTVFGDQMFTGCSNLTTLEFTDCDTMYNGNALIPFDGCNVKELRFQNGADGMYYRHTDGCYYTDDTLQTLVFAPQDLKSYTAPDSLRTICAGAFAGNSNLRSVNLGNVTAIGNYAFANATGLNYKDYALVIPASVTSMGEGVFYGCYRLKNVRVDAQITELPADTFAYSALNTITLSPTIQRLGDRAFFYTDFGDDGKALNLTATNITSLGDYVFAYTYCLKEIHLPALKEVGFGTFFYAPDTSFAGAPEKYPLAKVTFAPGTTAIGTATFFGYGGFPYLTEISLPDSVKNSVTEIADATFAGCSAVTELNFGKLTYVGDLAFSGCTALSGLDTSALVYVGEHAFANCGSLTFSDLSHVTFIGSSAFAYTKVTVANLRACQTLESRAFYGSTLTTLHGLDELTTIGDYAFANTNLSGTFTFPATLAAKRGAVGKGIFTGTQISRVEMAAENARYFVVDGVLFLHLENGATELVLCPPAYNATSYLVPEGTVRIGDDAFRDVKKLETVTFAASVTAIGDKAFYACGAKTYIFTGLTAPILETYIANTFEDDTQRYIFSTASAVDRKGDLAKAEEKYYANFLTYAALVLYPEMSGMDSLGLTLSYPANAAGFDGRIWTLFFANAQKSAIMPEEETKQAMEAIENLPTPEEIAAVASMQDKDAAKAQLETYKAAVKNARLAYNKVANVDQKAFITDASELFAAEVAIRAARTALGETVRIDSLRVKTSPKKLTYQAGELFDATGMVLTVIYDDASEEDVSTGFVLPTEPLYAGQQTVKFNYCGIDKEISVTVNRAGTPEQPDQPIQPDQPTQPGQPDAPGTPENPQQTPGGLPVGAVIAIVAGAVVICGAVVLVVIRKKRKS